MTFWELFIILLVFVPLIMLWVFTLVDLFQRPDLSGVAKALWAIAVVLLPLIAMLIYFIMRDTDAADPGAPQAAAAPAPRPTAVPTASNEPVGAADAADQLDRLADLRDPRRPHGRGVPAGEGQAARLSAGLSMEIDVALVVLVIAPLFVLWIIALFHIVARRPDLSVGRKGIWSTVVILLGYAGLLLYAMFRSPRPITRTGVADGTAGRAALHRLSRLIEDHDAGSISDEAFARDKGAVFGLEEAAS